MISQETVKEKLLELYPSREPFTVVFSGKRNGRVNGAYFPGEKKILIHEPNFRNDNDLIYTAIHELAHHLQTTEYGERKKRCHTKLFRAVFHDLLEKAGEKGIHVRDRPAAIKDLAEKAKKIDRKIAALQRELGIILGDLRDLCVEAGTRYEDVVENDIGMTSLTAGKAWRAAAIPPGAELGQDAQALVLRAADAGKQAAIIEQAEKGKSVAQIEQMAKPRKATAGDAVTDLLKEMRRIEITVKGLQSRYAEITGELERLRAEQEKEGGAA
jgi:hypothetical protein